MNETIPYDAIGGAGLTREHAIRKLGQASERLCKTVESHILGCRCDVCASFMDVMDVISYLKKVRT